MKVKNGITFIKMKVYKTTCQVLQGFGNPQVIDIISTIDFSNPLLYRKQNAKNMQRTGVMCLNHPLNHRIHI